MRIYVTFLVVMLTFIYGCKHSASNESSKKPANKTFDFSYTKCLKNCDMVAGIKYQQLKNDSLILTIGANLNCVGQDMGFSSEYKIRHDTLFLDISLNKDSNGHEVKAACNCYYNLQYRLPNVKKIPKNIIINNQDFASNTRDSIY